MDSQVIEIIAVMGFGSIVWLWAMRELLRKDEVTEGNKTVAKTDKKSHEQSAGTTTPFILTYITKEQIMDLTAEQIKEIPESEVDKLPTAMKDMFKKRRNEVLLADKTKKNK